MPRIASCEPLVILQGQLVITAFLSKSREFAIVKIMFIVFNGIQRPPHRFQLTPKIGGRVHVSHFLIYRSHTAIIIGFLLIGIQPRNCLILPKILHGLVIVTAFEIQDIVIRQDRQPNILILAFLGIDKSLIHTHLGTVKFMECRVGRAHQVPQLGALIVMRPEAFIGSLQPPNVFILCLSFAIQHFANLVTGTRCRE